MNQSLRNYKSNLEFGICASPAEAAGLPAGSFDFLEVNVQNFLVPEKGEADFTPNLEAGRATAKPIRAACCFLPGDLKCVGPEIDEARLLSYAETAFSRAARVGLGIIVFGSGGARTAPEGYPIAKATEDFVDVLRKIGPIAERHGIMVAVEPLNKGECNLITTLAEGADAVERANHPSVMLLADYFHMLKDGEPASEVVRFGHLIRHAHLSELERRACPGTSGDDFSPFFEALEEIGYKGRVSLECIWKDMPGEIEAGRRYLRG
jgi:sugar phosphate isomerase/epimerase